MDGYLSPPAAPVRPFRPPVRMAANRIVTLAAVVAILFATAGTAWMQRDRLGFGGGGDGPEPLSYASFMLPNGQEVEIAYEVPAEEDCTVEPLTVDEVMAKISGGQESWDVANFWQATPGGESDNGPDQTVDPTMAAEAAQEGNAPKSGGLLTVSEADYNAIAAVQREWLACAMYGSPLQRWALESGTRVRTEFQQRYFPVFDMAQIRRDLDALAAGDESRFPNPVLTDESILPMVPVYAEGYNNVMQAHWKIDITVFWMLPDGTPLLGFGESEEDLVPFLDQPTLIQLLPDAWNFVKDPATGAWLLNDMIKSKG